MSSACKILKHTGCGEESFTNVKHRKGGGREDVQHEVSRFVTDVTVEQSSV